ncbi:MAG: hypothetical protein K2G55_15230 [Lachnospiraceae bacterium]|nr:hypothetical protein [Lachnospiraceae bacterium]
MKRVINFGSFTISQQLDMLESYMKKGEILLFQHYDCGKNNEYFMEQDCINDYFENYCDGVIYYYNPDLRFEIYNNVIQELVKDVEYLGETNEKRKIEKAKKLFHQMKAGDYTDICEKTLGNIKRIVFDKLMNCNRDIHEYEYVMERMYGKSKWILDERGIGSDTKGAVWYKPANRDECCHVLEASPLFSCIILEDGEDIDNFSVGFVVEETADHYDLLILKNN